MPERKHELVCGEYYHVYNRGNSKQTIFFDDHDYRRFQRLLFLSNGTEQFKVDYVRDARVGFYEYDKGNPIVAIGAYCLMPNHFHILITPVVSGGLSAFMRKLSTGYSMYFNNKYNRTGSLFEGVFKSQLVQDDRYLKYLYAYIHLNPLKLIEPHWRELGMKDIARAQGYIEDYWFSSTRDYLEMQREEGAILHKEYFPNYFDSTEALQKDMYVWFSNRKDLSEDVVA